MENSLGQTLASYVSAGLGAFLAIAIGVSHRQLCALISFAAGTLLSTAVFHIVPEALHSVPWPHLLIAFASGYALFFLISKYVTHVCPACAASHFEHQQDEPASKFRNVFFLLAIALSIHSAMDGVAIALGKEMGEAHQHSIFFAVAIHKLPEGLALCALLLKSGYKSAAALVTTLLFEISTLVGWLIGFELLKTGVGTEWIDLVMVHVAGGFLYLALHATINEAKDHSPKLVFGFFLIGFLFMALVS